MASLRWFGIALAGCALATLATVFGAALWLCPMKDQLLGDIARIGWYSNNFWTFSKPMIEFPDPLYAIGDYDRYYDVMVLGDSFSVRPEHSWPNYLAAQGYSVRVQNLELSAETAMQNLLKSEAFRKTPPRLVIYASVERAIRWRLGELRPDCDVPLVATPATVMERRPQQVLSERPFLQPRAGNLSEDQITYARDFLVAQLRRRFARSWPVQDYALTKRRFSSVAANRVLSISDEPEKIGWKESDFAHMRCVLRRFQNEVQANGKTRFVVMIVPDKLSIYHDDLVDQSLVSTVIPRLADPALAFVRLDTALRAAVVGGELDVYLPNDTHWGAAGQRLAAQTLLEFLRQRGIIPE